MKKRTMLNVALVIVLIGVVTATFVAVRSSSASTATTQTLATAKRGTVLESVTSTGNVEAPTNLSLSFQQSGQVTAIYVHAGDSVVANEPLAKVDDTQQSQALASANASLASANAALAALRRGETAPERASDSASIASAAQSVASAQQSVSHAQQLQAANATKYDQSIAQAQTSASAAHSGTVAAQNNLDAANSALHTLQNSADPRHSSSETTAALLSRYRLDQVSCSGHTNDSAYQLSDGVKCSQIQNLLTFAQNVDTAESGLTQAQSQETSAQQALTNATTARTSGQLQDKQSVENAQSQLTSAQEQYNSSVAGVAVKQQAAKPEQIAQQQAAVTSAEQQVASAQKNEDDTTLRAPVAGTVASINGIVGQQSSAASAASAASSASSASSSSASSSSSSSSGFITLTDVAVLNVKVGFTESDAPKVRVGQAATITLSALPNKTFTGRVISLDTDSTVVSNVVTYYAEVAFDGTDAGVKPGMTASVNVVLDKRVDVITLPTSAVSSSGTTQTVIVRSGGNEGSRSITIGLRGDNAVEVTSGLAVGDQVVVRSTASSATGSGFPGGGAPPGAGGLGGGFGGGGGR